MTHSGTDGMELASLIGRTYQHGTRRSTRFLSTTTLYWNEKVEIMMKQTTFTTLIAATALALSLLVGCGATSTATLGAAAGATSTAQPTAPLNGCPTQLIPVDPPVHGTTVTLTQADASKASVMTTVGTNIEIKLPATNRWQLDTVDMNQTVTLSSPAGYFNKAQNVCVWRVTATAAGTSTLTFTGTAVCVAGTPCPSYALLTKFVIIVQ